MAQDVRPTFVDRMGDFFETTGMPRIAGRLFGWLLICDPPEQSSSDLAEAVDASPASVSTMARLLLQRGLIERTGRPGSRRHWYRTSSEVFTELLRLRVQQITRLRELAEEGLAELDEEGDRTERLREMRDFYEFFERELPALIEEYAGRS